MSHSLSMSSYAEYSHHLIPSSPSPLAISFTGLHPLSGITISPSQSAFKSGFQLSPIILTPRGNNRPKSVPPPAPVPPEVSPLTTPQLTFTPSTSRSEASQSQGILDPSHLGPHFSYYGRHLPHFHPPKYSRRLRSLVSNKRKKPLRISLLPIHGDGRARWAKIDVDDDGFDTSTSTGSFVLPEKLKWMMEPRVILALVVLIVVLGVTVTAVGISSMLGYR